MVLCNKYLELVGGTGIVYEHRQTPTPPDCFNDSTVVLIIIKIIIVIVNIISNTSRATAAVPRVRVRSEAVLVHALCQPAGPAAQNRRSTRFPHAFHGELSK